MSDARSLASPHSAVRRELARALQSVPLLRVNGPFHRFADLWVVHQRLVARRKTEVSARLGAKMIGGRFTPSPFSTNLTRSDHSHCYSV
jgi:hypothetical protein